MRSSRTGGRPALALAFVAAFALAATALPHDGTALGAGEPGSVASRLTLPDGTEIETITFSLVAADGATGKTPESFDGRAAGCSNPVPVCLSESGCDGRDPDGNPYPTWDATHRTIYGSWRNHFTDVTAKNPYLIVRFAGASGEPSHFSLTPSLPHDVPPGRTAVHHVTVPEGVPVNEHATAQTCIGSWSEDEHARYRVLRQEFGESGGVPVTTGTGQANGPSMSAVEVWTYSNSPFAQGSGPGLSMGKWIRDGNALGPGETFDFSFSRPAGLAQVPPKTFFSGIATNLAGPDLAVEISDVWNRGADVDIVGYIDSVMTLQNVGFTFVVDGVGSAPVSVPLVYAGHRKPFALVIKDGAGTITADNVSAENPSGTPVTSLSGTGALVSSPPTFIYDFAGDQGYVCSDIFNPSDHPVPLANQIVTYPFVDFTNRDDPRLLGYANVDGEGTLAPGEAARVMAPVAEVGTFTDTAHTPANEKVDRLVSLTVAGNVFQAVLWWDTPGFTSR